MGVVSTLAGIGGLMRDAGSLSTVLRGDKAQEAKAEHLEYMAALKQLGAEFEQAQSSWFDRLINGLNRIPRPALAMGTLGLFVYAMSDPIGFASRMQGLELVPDPLWWLLGAIVSFYFGARELHYFRDRRPKISIDSLISVNERRMQIDQMRKPKSQDGLEGVDAEHPFEANPALEDWRRSQD